MVRCLVEMQEGTQREVDAYGDGGRENMCSFFLWPTFDSPINFGSHASENKRFRTKLILITDLITT